MSDFEKTNPVEARRLKAAAAFHRRRCGISSDEKIDEIAELEYRVWALEQKLQQMTKQG